MGFERIFFAKHLEKGETILFAIHRHWILLLKPALAVGFFGFLIPWTLYAIGFSTEVFFWAAVVWSALAYAVFLVKVFEWYANSILITSAGLLQIHWKGFFSNHASRVAYEDVEGGEYEIQGFWPTVLRYGEFIVRLGSGNNFVLHYAQSPGHAEEKLMELQEAYMHDKNKKDVVGLKSLLSDLAVYHLKHKE